MHRVVEAHLKDFVEKFDAGGDQSKQFEAFVNYSIFRKYCGDQIDPGELVYEGDDPGIDGYMTFVDEAYVASVDEVEDALKLVRIVQHHHGTSVRVRELRKMPKNDKRN